MCKTGCDSGGAWFGRFSTSGRFRYWIGYQLANRIFPIGRSVLPVCRFDRSHLPVRSTHDFCMECHLFRINSQDHLLWNGHQLPLGTDVDYSWNCWIVYDITRRIKWFQLDMDVIQWLGMPHCCWGKWKRTHVSDRQTDRLQVILYLYFWFLNLFFSVTCIVPGPVPFGQFGNGGEGIRRTSWSSLSSARSQWIINRDSSKN